MLDSTTAYSPTNAGFRPMARASAGMSTTPHKLASAPLVLNADTSSSIDQLRVPPISGRSAGRARVWLPT